MYFSRTAEYLQYTNDVFSSPLSNDLKVYFMLTISK
jgi:hypothetical protein